MIRTHRTLSMGDFHCTRGYVGTVGTRSEFAPVDGYNHSFTLPVTLVKPLSNKAIQYVLGVPAKPHDSVRIWRCGTAFAVYTPAPDGIFTVLTAAELVSRPDLLRRVGGTLHCRRAIVFAVIVGCKHLPPEDAGIDACRVLLAEIDTTLALARKTYGKGLPTHAKGASRRRCGPGKGHRWLPRRRPDKQRGNSRGF